MRTYFPLHKWKMITWKQIFFVSIKHQCNNATSLINELDILRWLQQGGVFNPQLEFL